MINNFSCEKEIDIENFIRNNSIYAEKAGTCISYFIIDEDMSDNTNLCVLGYYGLALKILHINKTTKVTAKHRRKLRLKSEGERVIPAYLIAQLAKNDDFKDNIKGDDILENALGSIINAIQCVGGRVVWVEANKDKDKVMDFYLRNGFKEIQTEVRDGITFSQLFKLVKPSTS